MSRDGAAEWFYASPYNAVVKTEDISHKRTASTPIVPEDIKSRTEDTPKPVPAASRKGGKGGNNNYGNKGTHKCHKCRQLKGKVTTLKVALPDP
jgi:hypothetical protein